MRAGALTPRASPVQRSNGMVTCRSFLSSGLHAWSEMLCISGCTRKRHTHDAKRPAKCYRPILLISDTCLCTVLTGKRLRGWRVFPLPLDNLQQLRLNSDDSDVHASKNDGPAFYRCCSWLVLHVLYIFTAYLFLRRILFLYLDIQCTYLTVHAWSTSFALGRHAHRLVFKSCSTLSTPCSDCADGHAVQGLLGHR